MGVDIKELTIRREHRMIVLASDGVWDQITNEEVAKMAFRYSENSTLEAAVNAIISEARTRWTNAGQHVDDVTCIIVLLNGDDE